MVALKRKRWSYQEHVEKERLIELEQQRKEGKLISKDDIRNIVRIEYRSSSNWTVGYEYVVWVLKIEDGKVIRQVYTGKPLFPGFVSIKNHEEYFRKEAQALRNGERRFVNSYTVTQLFTGLEELGIDNWLLFTRGDFVDGGDDEFVFYVRKDDGSIKTYKYIFVNESTDIKTAKFFSRLFEATPDGGYETVSPDMEIMNRFTWYQPGYYEVPTDKKN